MNGVTPEQADALAEFRKTLEDAIVKLEAVGLTPMHAMQAMFEEAGEEMPLAMRMLAP